MDVSPVQPLISIDIADAREKELIQQQRFDHPFLVPDPADELPGGKFQWLGPQSAQGWDRISFALLFQKNPTKLAGVVESKLVGTLPKRKDCMGMFVQGRLPREKLQSPGHA